MEKPIRLTIDNDSDVRKFEIKKFETLEQALHFRDGYIQCIQDNFEISIEDGSKTENGLILNLSSHKIEIEIFILDYNNKVFDEYENNIRKNPKVS